MRRAFLAMRPGLAGRLEAVSEGCARLGYIVHIGEPPPDPTPADICISWNRHGRNGLLAESVERAGGRVIVLENGYCGRDSRGRGLLAVARGQHLGAGDWRPEADASRWAALGIELRPWRKKGEHILICLSRGYGSAATAMPERWPLEIARAVKHFSGRPIVVRPHPETRCNPPVDVGRLDGDLADAHAVVIWGSNAGTAALIAGVPVFYALPTWILAGAACAELGHLDKPPLPDRLPAFVRMAWAQWTLAEIATGEPFDRLLREPT